GLENFGNLSGCLFGAQKFDGGCSYAAGGNGASGEQRDGGDAFGADGGSHWGGDRRDEAFGGEGFLFCAEARWFCSARAPADWYRDIQDAKVNAKLAAVLIPVAEHDVAEKESTGLSKDFLAAEVQAPGFIHMCVGRLGKLGADGSDGFVENLEQLLTICGLRKVEIGLGLGVGVDETDHASGYESQVIGELAGGHGFFMRLPSVLVFREAFDESAGDGGLGFELRKK